MTTMQQELESISISLDKYKEGLNYLLGRIESLENDNAKLKLDAERYNHIRSTIQTGAVSTMLPLYKVHYWVGYEPVSDNKTLDSAVDAAMKEKACRS